MKAFLLVASKIILYVWKTKHNNRSVSNVLSAKKIDKPDASLGKKITKIWLLSNLYATEWMCWYGFVEHNIRYMQT